MKYHNIWTILTIFLSIKILKNTYFILYVIFLDSGRSDECIASIMMCMLFLSVYTVHHKGNLAVFKKIGKREFLYKTSLQQNRFYYYNIIK